MTTEYDVAIFGGGPAGSLTACLLAKQCPELRICIIEKSTFPRHHIGESTLPAWSRVLKRAGVLELLDQNTIIKKGGVVFNWGPEEAGESWTVDFREVQTGRPAIGSWFINREVFDNIILQHAKKLGTTVLQGTTVEKVIPQIEEEHWTGQETAEHFTIHTSDSEKIIAKQVVDATGQTRLLSRLWKLPVHKHDDLNNFALYGYWKTTNIVQPEWELREAERWAVFSSTDDGWVWFIPIDLDIVSVGFVTDQETLSNTPKEQLSERYFQSCQSASQIHTLLKDATFLGDRPDGSRPQRVSAIQDWSYRSMRSCGPGWFLVGDAAMFVDPILSSGLYLVSQGASMVANAISTILHKDTDLELLCKSYQQTYQELADSYVRMAKVWYQRNTRAKSWHWQARRERLRAGGPSLYERDQDAFTALALGALGSPLDAAVSSSSEDSWDSEFFIWLTAGRLFSDEQARGQQRIDADQARDGSRRKIAHRWRELLYSSVQLQEMNWHNKERYHSNSVMEHWERIHYLEVQPLTPEWQEPPIIFPCFPDLPYGILPLLNGKDNTSSIIREQLKNHPIASKERAVRIKSITEMLLRLQMLGLLHNIKEAPAPPSSNHAFLKVLIPAVLQSLDIECQVLFELDWLGELCTVRFIQNEQRTWLRCYDNRNLDPTKKWHRKRTTSSALVWDNCEQDWFQRFIDNLLPRLSRKEQLFQSKHQHSHWDENHSQAGLGIQFDFHPQQPLTAHLF